MTHTAAHIIIDASETTAAIAKADLTPEQIEEIRKLIEQIKEVVGRG